MIFLNREEAGESLAEIIKDYVEAKKLTNILILALPRGGLPVGEQIRKRLNVPMDAFLVRKIGAPGYGELAIGAIAMGGITVYNEDVLKLFHLSENALEQLTQEAAAELTRRNALYRKGRPIPPIKDKTIILVDDGLATGATMRAAIAAIKTLSPKKIIVAVPVSATDTYLEVEKEVDKIFCLHTSRSFSSVGEWYEDFSQVTDEEVEKLLFKKIRY